MVVDEIINSVVPLLGELGIFAIAATVIGWVAKDAISQHFDKELSKYEAEIDKELDRYRAELDKEKYRFSQLHNKRARITADLYEKFIIFEEDMRSLTDPMEYSDDPPKDEKLKTAAESGNEFLNFYMKNKIYFPPEICDTVEDIHEEMKSVYNEFGIYKPYEAQPGDPQDPRQWLKAWKRVTEEDVPELKKELENHFRQLLGVEVDQQDG